ncbi:cytochrome c oxidase assembly protein subunit 15 [Azospirillum fermentarium]|uniref:COX15/CtaA family protein n=1 Tax=Azospirillum fermentarium TaxID=1233114 RepID=UPI002227E7F9|nr:COX15/CtaA family protein [Azospirillum fermentarium]MCW2244897.1 cytochrome c oxidase assembly protein subunit 15 [Azospirillum fermentarium]
MTAVTVLAGEEGRPSVRPVAVWLYACCAMIVAMAVIGAVTRLTESGLSMAEWKPLIGILPPLSDAEWHRVFALYQATPEFRIYNSAMDLDGFRRIFWWEWFHRLWGQAIGFAFLLPFLAFLVQGRLTGALALRLGGLFLLGGLQGLIGWYMVMSGLVDRPEVSHYRLALHLGTAIVIYGLTLRLALGISDPLPLSGWHPQAGALRRHGRWALAVVGLTIVWGAFVAGLDAGLAYNTFPTMAGHWIPPEVGNLTPWWLNPLENTAAVQLIHRTLALTSAAVVVALAVRVWRAELPGRTTGRVALALGIAVVVQVGLGIATLLSVVWIPVAAAHQAGALAVVGLLVALLHRLRE